MQSELRDMLCVNVNNLRFSVREFIVFTRTRFCAPVENYNGEQALLCCSLSLKIRVRTYLTFTKHMNETNIFLF
jgi:hypothetical protein